MPSGKGSFNYWLTLPGGNGWKRINVGLIGRNLPDNCKIKDSRIVKDNELFKALICIEEKRTIEQANAASIQSVDLGINKPITTVRYKNGKMMDYAFCGSEIKNLAHKRMIRAKKLQKHRTKIGKYLKRYTNAINDYVHKYTRSIVNKAEKENSILVVGNIRNITKTWDKVKRKRNKTFRRKAKPTPYGKIMSQLWYKGTLSNVQVIFQNEAYTSKGCSRCGALGCRANEWFICLECGYQNQADLNGAINIAKAYQRDANDSVRLSGKRLVGTLTEPNFGDSPF